MKADEMLPAWVADISHLLRRIGKQAAYTMKFAYRAMREIKMVKRMIILKPSKKISIEDVEKMIDSKKRADTENENSLPTLAQSERRSIEQALIKCKGVIGGKKGAARLLGVARSTLQYRMTKHGIKPKKVILLDD